MPFQRTSLSGSTKNSQTVSGLAASEIVRSIEVVSVVASMLLQLLLLRFAFECFEPHVPELLEEVLELGEPFGTYPVQAPRAVPSLTHEPRLLQDVQVLGDRRPRDVEVRRDLAGAQLVVTDERENLTAPGRGDCFQRSLHRSYLSRSLRKKQLTHLRRYGSRSGSAHRRDPARARGVFEIGVGGRLRLSLAGRRGGASGGRRSAVARDIGSHDGSRRRMARAAGEHVSAVFGRRRG